MVHKIVNQEDLENKFKDAGDKLVVIDFYATWCGPCKRIAPFIDELEKKHQDKVLFLKVDVDENEAITATYSIEVMPTFVLVRNGKHLDTMTGSDEKKLQETIEKQL